MPKKNVALKVRVESELRQAFIDICRAEDRPAAQVIREFMRDYVASHGESLQQPLFDSTHLGRSEA